MRQRRPRKLYRLAAAGDVPAEELRPAEREQLVTELATAGWETVDIAEHTRMSTYTTNRIRQRRQGVVR